jgi:serine/threonine protein kinase
MRELILLHALSAHPNIVDVFGYTLNGSVAGMVLEYAADRDLKAYLRREGLSLPLQTATAMMVRLAEAAL